MDAAQKAAAERRIAIKEGVSKKALKALKERFQPDLPVFQFRDGNGYALANDAQTISLLAAIRDGQREVLTYLDRIINDTDND